MNSNRRVPRESFALALPTVLLLGAAFAAAFFGLIIMGPLDFELLRRYCLSHPVAIASVSLFFIGIVTLVLKWVQAIVQSQASIQAAGSLRRLITDGEEVPSDQRAEWLGAHWQSLPKNVRDGWLGRRVLSAIELQIQRGRRYQIEADLKEFSNSDQDRQHDSYSLLRIINWAMPMLGFLGTVLGISQTLGQLDTQKLATQQQEAMNELTAGLYVAFDTTAIALVLTVFLMFVQFAVSRLELNLLTKIDREAGEGLIRFLSADPYAAQDSLLAPVRDMAEDLLASVRQLVEEQASIWSRSIAESQRQWAAWTDQAALKLDADLGQRVSTALEGHAQALGELQDEGCRQVDLRWQQWQTTLSDQARLVQGQQQEIIKQTHTLQELVDSTCELRKLEEVVHDGIIRFESINRIEEASLCVGEAVAVLAASLERAGIIRSTPLKPRAVTRPWEHATEEAGSSQSTDRATPSRPSAPASDQESATSVAPDHEPKSASNSPQNEPLTHEQKGRDSQRRKAA